MKKLNFTLLACSVLVLLSSCEAIGDIFKAGVWTGILGVIVIVGLIVYFVTKRK